MENDTKVGSWKELMVNELSAELDKNPDFFISGYLGTESEDLNSLRRRLEEVSSRCKVVKNSIAKNVMAKRGLDELIKAIEGGTAIVFGGNDSAATAKIMAKFTKEKKSVQVRAGYLDGAIIDQARVSYLATLPGKKELIAKVVYGIKSPITGFVYVLANTLKSFLYVLQAIKEKKGGS